MSSAKLQHVLKQVGGTTEDSATFLQINVFVPLTLVFENVDGDLCSSVELN
jgi:hypothetical protein